MLLAAMTLAHLLRACAPSVSPATMTAIIRVESGGDTLAIHDNSIGRSFAPGSTVEAVAWANQLLAMGHSIDAGISQVNSGNFGRLGLTPGTVFDPCTNVRAGSTILSEDYRNAERRFGPGQLALRRAIGAYNTGSIFAGQTYVNEILVAAGLAPDDDYVPPLAGIASGGIATSVGIGPNGGTGNVAPPPVAAAAPGARRKAGRIPGTEPATGPAYTVQRTAGSPVTVLVGN
jgi:type IV secretion system protein VirB1